MAIKQVHVDLSLMRNQLLLAVLHHNNTATINSLLSTKGQIGYDDTITRAKVFDGTAVHYLLQDNDIDVNPALGTSDTVVPSQYAVYQAIQNALGTFNIINITWAAMVTACTSGFTLLSGRFYNITDAGVSSGQSYGALIVQALSDRTITKDGIIKSNTVTPLNSALAVTYDLANDYYTSISTTERKITLIEDPDVNSPKEITGLLPSFYLHANSKNIFIKGVTFGGVPIDDKLWIQDVDWHYGRLTYNNTGTESIITGFKARGISTGGTNLSLGDGATVNTVTCEISVPTFTLGAGAVLVNSYFFDCSYIVLQPGVSVGNLYMHHGAHTFTVDTLDNSNVVNSLSEMTATIVASNLVKYSNFNAISTWGLDYSYGEIIMQSGGTTYVDELIDTVLGTVLPNYKEITFRCPPGLSIDFLRAGTSGASSTSNLLLPQNVITLDGNVDGAFLRFKQIPYAYTHNYKSNVSRWVLIAHFGVSIVGAAGSSIIDIDVATAQSMHLSNTFANGQFYRITDMPLPVNHAIFQAGQQGSSVTLSCSGYGLVADSLYCRIGYDLIANEVTEIHHARRNNLLSKPVGSSANLMTEFLWNNTAWVNNRFDNSNLLNLTDSCTMANTIMEKSSSIDFDSHNTISFLNCMIGQGMTIALDRDNLTFLDREMTRLHSNFEITLDMTDPAIYSGTGVIVPIGYQNFGIFKLVGNPGVTIDSIFTVNKLSKHTFYAWGTGNNYTLTTTAIGSAISSKIVSAETPGSFALVGRSTKPSDRFVIETWDSFPNVCTQILKFQ